MRRRKKFTALLGTFIALTLVTLGAVPAQTIQQVSTNFSMPAQLSGTVSVSDCANAPGPQITLEGALVLAGVDVALIFRNQREAGAPHERVEEIQQVATGVPAGEQIVIPKQPVRGGTGGNPFIWVQLIDTNGNALTGEIFLGRCVQGPWPVSQSLVMPATATAILAVLDCTNNPGPFITVDGSLSFFPGVKARFIFRNNDNPVGGPHEAVRVVDIGLILAGFTLKFPKQPVLGGVGGNPWISVQFLSSDQPVGSEFLLGRCVQLLPGN